LILWDATKSRDRVEALKELDGQGGDFSSELDLTELRTSNWVAFSLIFLFFLSSFSVTVQLQGMGLESHIDHMGG